MEDIKSIFANLLDEVKAKYNNLVDERDEVQANLADTLAALDKQNKKLETIKKILEG